MSAWYFLVFLVIVGNVVHQWLMFDVFMYSSFLAHRASDIPSCVCE